MRRTIAGEIPTNEKTEVKQFSLLNQQYFHIALATDIIVTVSRKALKLVDQKLLIFHRPLALYPKRLQNMVLSCHFLRTIAISGYDLVFFFQRKVFVYNKLVSA